MPAVEVSPEEAMQRLMQAAGPGAGGSGPVREGSNMKIHYPSLPL